LTFVRNYNSIRNTDADKGLAETDSNASWTHRSLYSYNNALKCYKTMSIVHII